MSSKLANLESQLADTQGEWEAGGGGEAWAQLARTFREYEAESRKGKNADVARMSSLLREAMDVVFRGDGAYRARVEARAIIERFRRVVDTEIKRQETARLLLRADQVREIVKEVGEAVNRHCDLKTKRLIYIDLERIMRTIVG